MKLTFISMLVAILALALVSAHPFWTGNTAYVGSIYQSIITSPDAYLNALLTHQIDVGYAPDLAAVAGAGYTLSTMERLGQVFLITNNRVWPTGTDHGSPSDADYPGAQAFRKALFRLIDRVVIVNLYKHLQSRADFWLPPGQTKWIEQDPASPDYALLPTTDRMTAKGLLDAYFPSGFTDNPFNDPETMEPWESSTIRQDPRTGNDLATVELLTLPSSTDPQTFQSALLMADWWRLAGIPVSVVPSAFNALVSRLVNTDLYDYQIIHGVGLVWGSTAPDILYDLTCSENLPWCNFVAMNRSDLDYWDETMMSTLDSSRVLTATHEIQKILRDTEPYLPLMLWRDWTAFNGPWGAGQGYLGIVNAMGWGAASSFDNFGKLLGRADRSGDDLVIRGMEEDLNTLNPLTAPTVYDWSVLGAVTDGLLQLNPYNQKYMAWAADPDFMNFDPSVGYTPKIKAWIGPGRAQDGGDGFYNTGGDVVLVGSEPPPGAALETPGALDNYFDKYANSVWDVGEPAVRDTNDNGVYDAGDVLLAGDPPALGEALKAPGTLDKYRDANSNNTWDAGEPAIRDINDNDKYEVPGVTYAVDPDTGRSELATYNGIPVADVTAADLQGDDQLGMRTIWKLRDKMYWHNSDPGVDGILGTVDDGVTYQVTTADVEFMMNKILIGQENQRYFSSWWFVNNYTAIDTLKFEVYEERQYLFAFEDHGVALLGPIYIFEPDLIGPDNMWGTADDIHHQFWTGWQTPYYNFPYNPTGQDLIYARNGMP